jgi:superfamily II DNA/RNA helicase
LVKNLAERGFQYPTEIQDKIIPHGMTGDDVIGLASTGSGKTIAFLLPLVQKIMNDKKQKVIILAPTRELAQQINKELMDSTKGMQLFSTVCVGGMPIYRQIQSLKRSNHFVIGTPGRLKDLSDRGVISFSNFQSIVLDEVDRMLDMGFVDDMTAILKELPPERQAFFFSATMPDRIKNLIKTFLKEPIIIDTGAGVSTKNVAQDIVRTTTNDEKFTKLTELLKASDGERSIVFVETKSGVDQLTRDLQRAGFKTGLLHGDRRQRERERTLQQFKAGDTTVLVATDVAARGIDVKDVFQVINFTIPQTHDDYIHRIGRTGRAGKTGRAFTFV